MTSLLLMVTNSYYLLQKMQLLVTKEGSRKVALVTSSNR